MRGCCGGGAGEGGGKGVSGKGVVEEVLARDLGEEAVGGGEEGPFAGVADLDG